MNLDELYERVRTIQDELCVLDEFADDYTYMHMESHPGGNHDTWEFHKYECEKNYEKTKILVEKLESFLNIEKGSK